MEHYNIHVGLSVGTNTILMSINFMFQDWEDEKQVYISNILYGLT